MTTAKPLTEEQLNAIDHWVNNSSSNPPEMMQRYVPMLIAEIRRLHAVLDGDPEQTATPDQRRAWRRSAIRYADKIEAERDEVLELLDFIIAGYEAEGIGPLLLSIRAAQKWRQAKTAQDAQGAPQ